VGTVRETVTVEGSVHEALSVWCDTSRWPSWVEGMERVVSVTDGWPEVGGVVRWESTPAGRGSVTERVVSYEPLTAIESEIDENQMTAIQRVTFTPSEDTTEVALELSYRIRRRNPLTPLIDVLFVRAPMRASLRTTLSRFNVEVALTRRT
jgi:uncharacterized membrane protein